MAKLLRDRRVRFALALAFIEWLSVSLLALLGDSGNFPIAIGILVLASLLQLQVLFGGGRPMNGRPKGEFSYAQHAFIEGRYDDAEAILLKILEKQPAEVTALTLLGNSYRQMGRLSESHARLSEALIQQPDGHFPLYGLGRTQLAQGDFMAAAASIEKALAQGGRKAIRAELALAYFLADESEKAAMYAHQAARSLGLEGYRVLMVNYLLHTLRQDAYALPLIQRNAESIRYWQGEQARFAESPYGAKLGELLQTMQPLIDQTLSQTQAKEASA